MKKELTQVLLFWAVVIVGAVALTAILSSCKTQRTVAPFVLRDSISITYKQGTVQPLSLHNIAEQPTPIGVRGAAIESRKNSSVPADGTVGLGATREASVFEGLLSQRTNKPAVPPSITIRVDTVFVERWHTEVCQPQAVCQRSGLSGEAGLSAKRSQFYKNCTKGFFILLLLMLGRIALRILKAVCLRR